MSIKPAVMKHGAWRESIIKNKIKGRLSYSIGPLLLVEPVHTLNIKTGRDEQVSIDRNRRMYIDLRTLGRIISQKVETLKPEVY